MRIAVVGGGPAGLSFGFFARMLIPGCHVTVWEGEDGRRPGSGLVLPERLVEMVSGRHPGLARALRRDGAGWDRIDIHFRGQVLSSDGHQYLAVGRARLLHELRRCCQDLRVDLRPGAAPSLSRLAQEVDVLVGADGGRSVVRRRWAAAFEPTVRPGRCRFRWLDVPGRLDAFVFCVIESEHGVVQLHCYPYQAGRSAVIVEMPEEVRRRLAPGWLGRGALPPALHPLVDRPDGPGWQRFHTVQTRHWSAANVVLIGDAAHAAHFSVGSGTKAAVEDALALAECLAEGPVPEALRGYERRRRPAVTALQQAAAASQAWFEQVESYLCDDPVAFARSLLTRSGRVSGAALNIHTHRTTTTNA